MTWFVHLFTPLFRSLFGSTYAPNFIFRSFHIIFIENKVWKQVTLKHSTVSYHNRNIWLQDSTKSKNELCCRLPHAKGLHVIFENEKDEILLPHFTAFYYYGNLCTATQSIWREMDGFFFHAKIYKLVLMIWKAFHNIEHSSGANAQGSLPEILTLQTTNKPYRKENKRKIRGEKK